MKVELDPGWYLLYEISNELHESACCDKIITCHFNNDDPLTGVVNMMVFINPPDPDYGKLYMRVANGPFPDPLKGFTKYSRISLTEPKYIHCSDDSTPEWILNDNEKKILMEILAPEWNNLLHYYKTQTEAIIGKSINIEGLPMPDYTKLK